jgi:uncharacterized membrane protein YgcG
MFWAEFHLGKDQETAIVILVALGGGVICGVIPFVIGLLMRQPTVGVICGIIAGAAGALSPCCFGIPAVVVLSGVVVIVGMALRHVEPQFAPPVADAEDIARGFQLPGSKDEPPPSRYSDTDRDRRHQEKFGFRPRQRRPDSEGGSSSGGGSSHQ